MSLQSFLVIAWREAITAVKLQRESLTMSAKFRLTMAQLNATVGDLAGNAAKAKAAHAKGAAVGADYVALPEMFLCGYQAQDLVLRRAFVADCERYLTELAEACADGPALGIGAPMREGHEVFNCYFVLSGGKIAVTLKKHHLPHTHVFDEHRFYEIGPINGPYRIGDMRVGSPICEDAWYPDVCEAVAESGAQMLMIPNGSPYYRNKFDVRLNKMVAPSCLWSTSILSVLRTIRYLMAAALF